MDWTMPNLFTLSIALSCLLLATLPVPTSATFSTLMQSNRGPPPPPTSGRPPNPLHLPPLHSRREIHLHAPKIILRRDAPHRLAPHKMKLKMPPPSRTPPRISRGTNRLQPKMNLRIPPYKPMNPNHLPINKNAHHHRGKLFESDLLPAAQTLYDLRGFNIPLGGQEETQRFLRQQDPFTFSRPSGFHPPKDNRHNLDTRTAPLVFPSFYQQQSNGNSNPESNSKRPQAILNIFGHSQHLSQTKYEPAAQSQSQRNEPTEFRPSQVDVGFAPIDNNDRDQRDYRQQSQPIPREPLNQSPNQNLNYKPHYEPLNQLQGRQVQQAQNQPQQILNYRAPQLTNSNQGQDNRNQNQNQNDEPFVYVYDDEDYDEGEEFVDKPQNQINSNRVTTPTPSRTTPRPTAPLRTHGSTAFPTFPTTPPTAKPVLQSTTAIPISQHLGNNQNQNDFYSQIHQPQQNNNFFFNNNNQQSHRQDPFNNYQFGQSPRLSPTITPTPNVEIVPSSERKPPPDQSNAITPVLKQPQRVVNDDRFRRPSSSGNNLQQQQPRDYFQQNQNQNQNQRPFNQIVHVDEEEEEQLYDQDPEIIQKLNGPFSSFRENPSSRLRPVNTLVPKNRVPQEDVVLPPNFPFYEDIPITRVPASNLNANNNEGSTAGHNRGDIIRNNLSRPQQQSAEVSSQNQRGSRPTPSPPPSPSPTPSRVRGSPTRTTTPEAESEAPKRTRTRVPNIHTRVRTFTTTTTTPTTTTTKRPTTSAFTFRPPPSLRTTPSTTPAYDGDNEEYYDDDYDPPNLNSGRVVDSYEQVDRPKQTVTNKSPIRPNFHNTQNQIVIQELHSPKLVNEGPRRVRPQPTPFTTPAPQYFPSPTPRGQRFREQTTIESPPSFLQSNVKTTTGKPLYYAGKMLSKEGGLYAGQTIPLHHVYGAPVPNVPISTILDRMPAVLDGHVARVKPQNQNQRIRGREREKEQEVSTSAPTRLNSHPHSRLIHPSRIRANNQGNQSPAPERDTPAPEREVIRSRPVTPKFTRPQSQPVEPAEDSVSTQPSPPLRRKKIRPGQKFRQQQKPESSITVTQSVREEENEDDQDRPEPPRKNLRPVPTANRIRPQSQIQNLPISTSTDTPAPPTTPLAKLRPRRPRPYSLPKLGPPSTTPTPEDEEEAPQPKPQKRIRPRARPAKQNPNTQPEFSESVSFTQSSVKIGKKPTEAPGRFSSRFRDEFPSTIVTSTQSTTFDSDDDDNNFSPPPKPKPRPSFKPPTKPAQPARPQAPAQNKPKRIKPQQQNQGDPDDLPPSIRLSAKDVVLNRKPARRIPPGSASDRLKALQERRRKISVPSNFKNQQRQKEEEDNEDDEHRGHRTLRRRKLVNSNNGNNNNQPRLVKKQRVNQRQRQQEPEEEVEDENGDYEAEESRDNFQQNKREITHKTAARLKPQNNLNLNEYEDEVYTTNNEDEAEAAEEYDTLDKDRQEQIDNRKLSNRASGRNPSEVTSDEARAVLGIVIDKNQNNRRAKVVTKIVKVKPKQIAQEYEDDNYGEEGAEDYEGNHSHLSEHKVSTEVPPSSTIVVSTIQSTSTSESPSSTSTSSTTPTSNSKRSKLLSLKPITINTSVTTSTSTSASTSVSESEFDAESPSTSTTSKSTEGSTTAAYLKARLRPNKKLLQSLQPRVSASQQRDKNESSRQSNLSKLLKLTTSSSTYSPVSNESKLFTMSTEDPSLPLEAMFSNMKA